MRVILTSFRDSVNWTRTHQYSIARWQPKNMGRNFPEIQELSARDSNGNPLRHLSPEEFREKYEDRLAGIGGITLHKLLERHLADAPEEDIVLLCWCNPDRQKEYSKLFCHRILVGYWIEEHYPEIGVIYADGADNPVWLPV